MSRGDGYVQGLGIPEGEGWVYQRAGAGYSRGGGISERGGYARGWDREGVDEYGHPFRHGIWDTLSPVLIPSGGHHNTYSWQAGGMHPIGMLSCYRICSSKGREG